MARITRARMETASRQVIALAGVFCVAFQPVLSFALPQGGQVAAGQAQIVSGATETTIAQGTSRAIIDWSSFDIGSGEAVQFAQPGPGAIALNRIHDIKASAIDGRLTANGNVWIVNPHGIVFGPGAVVNVGGLLASTADISNDNFLAGNYRFDTAGDVGATITNEGQITVADAGMLAFVAPELRNSGYIYARLGRVGLGAAETFTLDLYGDELIRLEASGAITQYLMEHSGTIDADGGVVVLSAAAGRELVDSLINVSGDIRAGTVDGQKGRILIEAGPDGGGTGTTLVSGNVSATGREGGNIDVLGDRVAIHSGAAIDASGENGGGFIRIGGDYQGQGVTPTASRVIVQSGSSIYANALQSGDGGRVIVWADERADFAGHIEARGVSISGDGGFVETSGREILVVTGTVDASSPWGVGGMWLLDPNNITINATADANASSSGVNPVVWDTTDDTAVVTVTSILTSLNAGTSVTIQTGTAGGDSQAGDITVAADIAKTTSGDATLLLKAANDIILHSNVDITSSSNKLNVTLNSDSDASGAGAIVMNSGSTIVTNGGNVVLGGGADPTATAAMGQAANVSGVSLSGATITAGGGNVSIRGTGYNTTTNSNYGVALTSTSSVTTTGTGTITVVGAGGGGSGNSGSNYGTYLSGSTITAVNGAISVTGTGGGAGTGTNNYGVYLLSTSGITSTGSGAITVTGVRGGGATASNYGLTTLTGTNTLGGGSATGDVTLSADTVSIANHAVTTTGGVSIKPYTASGTIGVAGATGTLAVTTGILGAITANTLTIGRSDGSGLMRMRGWDASARSYQLALVNGTGNIQLDGTVNMTMATDKNFSATTASTGDVLTANASADGEGIITSGTGTITLASGDDITIAHDFGLTSATGTITLQANGNISYSSYGDVTTGGGNIVLNSDRDASGAGAIYLGDYKDFTSNGGNIIFGGGADPSATAARGTTGTFSSGIRIGGGSTISAGGGNISMRGQGGSDAGGGTGVYNGAAVTTTGSGTISVTGTGGSAGNLNVGVWNDANDGVGFQTVDGNITVAGTGGTGSGNAIGYYAKATYADNGLGGFLRATGTGNIFLTGTGGNSTGGGDTGVSLAMFNSGIAAEANSGSITVTGTGGGTNPNTGGGNTGIDSNGTVQFITNSGNINLTGTGGIGSYQYNYGVNVSVLTTTSGDISITGTGGTSATGGWQGMGVSFTGLTVNSGSGDVTVTATGGNGADDIGYLDYGPHNIGGVGASGDITIIANLLENYSDNHNIQTTGTVTFRPRTAATTVGVNGAAGTLQVTSNWLDRIIAGTLTIGRADGSGLMRVNGWDASARTYHLALVNGSANIQFDGGSTALTLAANKNLTATTSALSDIVSGGAGELVTSGAGTITLTSDDDITFANDLDLTSATGAITLTAADDITYSGGGDITSTSGDVTLQSNTLDLQAGASVTTSGNAYVKAFAAATTVGVGGAVGTLNVSDTELGFFGANTLSIGRSDGSGLMRAEGDDLSARTYHLAFVNGTGTIQLDGTENFTLATNKNFSATTSGTGDIVTSANGSIVTSGTGAITLTSGDDITFGNDLDLTSGGSGAVTLDAADQLSYSGSGDISTGTGDITLIANGVALSVGTSMASGDDLVIKPHTANTSMGIGTGAGTGTLSISDAEIALLDWSSSKYLKLGDGAAGAMDINTAVAFTKPVEFRNAATYDITQSGVLTSSYNGKALVLASGDDYHNSVGAGAFSLSNGARWLIYSVAAADNTQNSLLANNNKYGETFDSYGPASVVEAGNVYIYSSAPVNILTFTIDNKSRAYGDANPTFTYNLSGLEIGDTAADAFTGDISMSTVANSTSNVGNYAITGAQGTLTLIGDYVGYTLDFVSGTLSVTAAALTVTANAVTGTYGSSSANTLNGTTGFGSTGLKNGETIGSVTLGTNATTSTSGNYNAGTWTVTASAATGGTFNASNYTITYQTAAHTVNQKALSITGVTANNKTYDASATATLNTGGAGLAGVVDGLNNGGGGPVDTVNLNVGGVSGTFADANVGNGKTVTTAGFAIGGADSANYTLSQPTTTATITAAGLTITATDQNQTYGFGGAGAALGTTGFNAVGLQGGQTIGSVTLNTNATTSASSNYNVGTWTLTPSAATGGTFNAANYAITYNNGTMTVNKANLTVTADDKTITYGTAVPAGSITYSGFVLGETSAVLDTTASVSSTLAGVQNAGTYADNFTASGAVDGNYSFTYVDGDLIVNKAALTAVVQDQSGLIYGDITPTLSVTNASHVVWTGLVNGDTAAALDSTTFSYGGATAGGNNNAGTFTLGISAFSDNNYSLNPGADVTTGTLTIGKKGLTVTIDDASRTYGDANPGFTAVYTGFVLGQNASVLDTAPTFSSAAASANAGTYAITGAGGLDNNYSYGSFVNGSLTVNPASLSVIANNSSMTVGGSLPAFSASYSGFKLGQNFATSGITGSPSLTTPATSGSPAGAYAITAALGSLSAGNYAFVSFIDGTLSIGAAPDSSPAGPVNAAYEIELRPKPKDRGAKSRGEASGLSFANGVGGLNAWHCFLFDVDCTDDPE